MNFVFIIDTSLSMNQTFDNISYFDFAKNSIRKFVLDREINNYRLNRKSDKYFLVTLNNVEENFAFNWSTNTEHFLCQLNALKISYDFTNIDYAIKKGFQIINFIKKMGIEKHIYGRLFSKIQNSYIILITDGGNFSSNEKLLSLNTCSNSTLLLKDQNKYILENYPILYKELYRWDQSLYAIVLTDKNNDFESFKILDKICKNVGGKIITVDNPILLNDKLFDLSNKYFLNNRVYINFNINKIKKKNNITYLEYNGNIDKMNEKWPFPDELIINKDSAILPTKNALPFYEFGNIKSDFSLPQEYYDEYDIKDKKFILNILIDGDCWNNMTLSDFIRQYKSSLTIDILVSDLKDKKIVKKPFAVICLIFTNELLEFIKSTIKSRGNTIFTKFFLDYQNYNINKTTKPGNICNHIKCKFFNLPYYYTEFFNLISMYKSQKKVDYESMELQLNLEKYFSIIPFYYIKHIINFFEKNKIKKLFNKDKEGLKKIINDNFSNEVLEEIKKISEFETKQVTKINYLFATNKQNHLNKKANCCKKEIIYHYKNNLNIINNVDKVEEDNEYLNFIDKCFKCDKLNNITKINNNSNSIYNLEMNNNRHIESLQFNNKLKEDNHENDIELMGDYRENYFRREHLRSYLIPEIEIRYLIKDYLFGNQFIERKRAYSSNIIGNNSNLNNDKIQDVPIFRCLNDEDKYVNINSNKTNNTSNINNTNNNTINKTNISKDYNSEPLDNQIKKNISSQNKEKPNYLINNKRNRENSMDDINLKDDNNTEASSKSNSPIIYNDILSESNGSNNLMLDEFSDNKYNSKLSSLLIEEFKNSINSSDNNSEDGMKISVKYKISNEKLNNWKFKKTIKNLSQELINSIHNDEKNIIKIIKKIIDENCEPDKTMTKNFVKKIYILCQNYGVNPIIQIQIDNLIKSFE